MSPGGQRGCINRLVLLQAAGGGRHTGCPPQAQAAAELACGAATAAAAGTAEHDCARLSGEGPQQVVVATPSATSARQQVHIPPHSPGPAAPNPPPALSFAHHCFLQRRTPRTLAQTRTSGGDLGAHCHRSGGDPLLSLISCMCAYGFVYMLLLVSGSHACCAPRRCNCIQSDTFACILPP